MAFTWKDRYSLGIEEIDAQHKKLFEIGNRAEELANLNGKFDNYDDIMNIITELLEYAQYHFDYEEEFMRSFNYDQLDNQIREHKYYLNKIKEISSQDIDEDQQKTILSILDFLSSWISSHILISDRRYVDYYRQYKNL